jgi:ectoine hydroxylase-related dioxygenase (phytanoyl-CoA dioxygenase family)
MLRGLNIGLHETFAYLYGTGPSLEQFELWILERNAGAIEPERIASINAAIDGNAPGAQMQSNAGVLSQDDLAFFDEHGYVVLHDAVTPENARAAAQAICDFVGIDIDRRETWYRAEGGRDPWVPLVHHPALDANRRSARIRKAFAQLWKRDDLWVSVDQCGLNLPETPDRPYNGQTLHWDVSLVPPIPFGLQGELYLTDTLAEQGAFTCVPGFHRKIDEWLAHIPNGVDPRRLNLYELGAVSVPGEAGDLIIWHQALPHAGSPNRADKPRVVQYINLRPSTWEYETDWK